MASLTEDIDKLNDSDWIIGYTKNHPPSKIVVDYAKRTALDLARLNIENDAFMSDGDMLKVCGYLGNQGHYYLEVDFEFRQNRKDDESPVVITINYEIGGEEFMYVENAPESLIIMVLEWFERQ